jgi:hypothetical protein
MPVLRSGLLMATLTVPFGDSMQGCSLAQAEGEWVVCRVFQTQRSSNRPRRRGTPAGHAAAAASPSSSTASCVTDGSDQEEVSS